MRHGIVYCAYEVLDDRLTEEELADFVRDILKKKFAATIEFRACKARIVAGDEIPPVDPFGEPRKDTP
jgi:hypothetical protein